MGKTSVPVLPVFPMSYFLRISVLGRIEQAYSGGTQPLYMFQRMYDKMQWRTFNNFPEARPIVYHNPDEQPEYREYNSSDYNQETDYANPAYYAESVEQPRPATPFNPYRIDAPLPPGNAQPTTFTYMPDSMQMQAYRSPQNGYTADIGAEQQDTTQQGQAGDGNTKKKVAGLGGLLLVIGGFLAKFTFLLKFGLFGFSALLSVFVYSFIFGWQFALGIVALLFIHEMGHAIVMKLKGIPVGGMIFIPLLGAAVMMQRMPNNAKDEAEVGIAGPIAGAIASSVCLLLAMAQPHSIWAPLAYFGFFINLFNLIPIVPFDGGRVLAAIDRRVWIIGFLGLLAYQIWSWLNGNFSPWLLLFVIIAATQLWTRGLAPSTPQGRAYYKVPLSGRITMAGLYFGMVAVLFLGMTVSHGLLPITVAR